MSNIVVSSNASGTGTLTVTSPNTNSNYTLTFPAETGTLITSATTTNPFLSVVETWTGTQTFNGTSSTGATKIVNTLEPATISATAATGTINFDVTTQSVLYYTTNASGNFTVNFRGSSGTSLNTVMSNNDVVTVTFLVTNGATPYYNSAVQVDGNAVTPKWQGGTAPTTGSASAIDIYNYVIVKTGSAAFTVFASQTKFA